MFLFHTCCEHIFDMISEYIPCMNRIPRNTHNDLERGDNTALNRYSTFDYIELDMEDVKPHISIDDIVRNINIFKGFTEGDRIGIDSEFNIVKLPKTREIMITYDEISAIRNLRNIIQMALIHDHNLIDNEVIDTIVTLQRTYIPSENCAEYIGKILDDIDNHFITYGLTQNI